MAISVMRSPVDVVPVVSRSTKAMAGANIRQPCACPRDPPRRRGELLDQEIDHRGHARRAVPALRVDRVQRQRLARGARPRARGTSIPARIGVADDHVGEPDDAHAHERRAAAATPRCSRSRCPPPRRVRTPVAVSNGQRRRLRRVATGEAVVPAAGPRASSACRAASR